MTNVTVRSVSGVERQCRIICYADEDIENLTISSAPEYAPIYKNLDLQTEITLYGETIANKLVTWTSDNTSVINVTSAGVVRTLGYGTATLTATTTNGLTKSVTITVMRTTDDFTLPESLTVRYGETLELNATSVTPEDAPLALTWTAEPAGYVSIDGSTLTPMVNENAEITLTALNWDGSTRTTTLTLRKNSMPGASFRLPGGTQAIEEEAFAGIPAAKIVVNDGCASIGSRAFADCGNLEAVYVPASVTSIADNAFEGCGSVTICGASGSEAEAFAVRNGFTFEAD